MIDNRKLLDPADAIESDYNQFWRDIVETDGQLDPDKVKRELYDYRVVMREVSRVYDRITRGHISKPNTISGFVIGTVEDLHSRDIQEIEEGRDKLADDFYIVYPTLALVVKALGNLVDPTCKFEEGMYYYGKEVLQKMKDKGYSEKYWRETEGGDG